jgi:hypothetical protein
MKRQVRKGVFESNSSSQHALIVKKDSCEYTPDEYLEEIYLQKDPSSGEEHCVWEPWDTDMEFGRSPFKVLGTFKDKWLYACASLVGEYNDETYKELVSLALKYIPGLKRIKMPTSTRSIPNKDFEGNEYDEYAQEYGKTEKEFVEYIEQKEKNWDMGIEYWKSKGSLRYDAPFTGYVDEDILSGFLEYEKISLEEYLTNKKYVVVVDGDEYCIWHDIKNSGLANIDTIDHEYPNRDY